MRGEIKRKVIANIFGESFKVVRVSGLIDAQNERQFHKVLVDLKEKWSKLHESGEQFHRWFYRTKAQEFLTSAIKCVRQRAGLGCPPERFTTNRSEQKKRIIQEFVKKEYGGKNY